MSEPSWRSLTEHLGEAVDCLMIPVESEERALLVALRHVFRVRDDLDELFDTRTTDVVSHSAIVAQAFRLSDEFADLPEAEDGGTIPLVARSFSSSEIQELSRSLSYLYWYAHEEERA